MKDKELEDRSKERRNHGHYPPYHPRMMMVVLLLDAYCRGIFSSRKIMEACEDRLTFGCSWGSGRWFAGT